MYIELGDVLVVLASISIVAITIYLIRALRQIGSVAKEIHEVLVDKRSQVTKTLDLLPGIAENVNEITDSVKNTAAGVEGAVGSFTGGFLEPTPSKSKLDGIVNIVTIVTELVGMVKEFLNRSK